LFKPAQRAMPEANFFVSDCCSYLQISPLVLIGGRNCLTP